MKLLKIAGVLLVVLLITTSVAAAVPGNAPSDSEADSNYEGSADERAQNEEVDNDDEKNEREQTGNRASQADERRGPPVDMPKQVPDFVGDVHDLIQQNIHGSVSDLGAQISNLTPGEESNEGGQESDSENGQDETTSTATPSA